MPKDRETFPREIQGLPARKSNIRDKISILTDFTEARFLFFFFYNVHHGKKPPALLVSTPAVLRKQATEQRSSIDLPSLFETWNLSYED